MLQDEKIWEKVQKVIDSATNDSIQLINADKQSQAPFLYNQRELVRRINFYVNDRYLERDNNAIFWNIATPRIPHFSKLLQFDTKDFLPMGEGELNMVQAWALRIKAREWFRDEGFYQTLNDLAIGLATYGGCVWKAVKEDKEMCLEECKLGNLYFDQAADDIKDTDVVEMHYLSQNELLEKRSIWNNVDDIFGKEMKDGRYEIWEYTGILIENQEPVLKHIIGYGSGDQYVELWNEEIDEEDNPYESFRLGKYNGRFLGVGVVERLFKLQERANELVNQNADTTRIASLLLFKSANMDLTGNVLEQAINGQIVPDETFQQVGIQNTGINLFIQELQLINQQADKLCLTPEIIQGEQAPSGTTFRGLAVMNAAAENAFTIYRQNLGEKVGDILMKWIFPQVIKGWNKESFIEIKQDDVDVEAYDKAVINYIAKEKMLGGEVVTEETLTKIAEDFQNEVGRVGRKIEIGPGFFDFKFGFKLQPTSETGDKMAMNDAMYNALQMTGANPALTEVPLFKQYCENNGISYWKLKPKQKEELMAMAQGQQQTGALPPQKKPDALLASAQPQM
jgi:hypothetical protein